MNIYKTYANNILKLLILKEYTYMFGFIYKKMKFLLSKSIISNKESKKTSAVTPQLSKILIDNLNSIKDMTSNSSDIIIREFSFGKNRKISAALIFVEGLTDLKIINTSIIEPLMYKASFLDSHVGIGKNSMHDIRNSILSVSDARETKVLDEVIEGFLAGNAVLLISGSDSALIISCKGWEKRGISEPATESVVRGPRESFIESLRTNTAMIRRKIKNPNLIIETLKLGKRTGTTVNLVFIKGIANAELIKNVKERLNDINTDSILESGYIDQYIEDAPFCIFSTIGYTEKPDVVAAKLLEGRVAILVDGTPFVLTAPLLFIEAFQSSEDYYSRPYFASMLRIVRYLAFLTTILVPALYVSITTYHHEIIPTPLLLTMAKAREGVPFPEVAESLIMLLVFEILREAGVRLPQPVGQAMSIVGALVMGEAAVSAGFIGAPMIIVIAITAVSSFAVPNQSDAAAMLRIIFLILASIMGNFGITMGILGTLVHLSSLKSFGFPYLSPIVPFQAEGLKDTLVRAPLWFMQRRPNGMALNDKKRRDLTIPPTKASDYNSEED